MTAHKKKRLPASTSTTHDAQILQRRDAKRARRELPDKERLRASNRIVSTVVRAPWFARAQLIGCYLAAPDEADTWPIISRAWRMKKRIFAPVAGKKGRMRFREITADSTLVRNRFGLFEPVDGEILPAKRLHVVLTPLVAFDEKGNRIGMGGGYYDRAFSFLKNRRLMLRPKLIGLAYDCQRVREITANPWDIRLYSVITEST